VLLVRSARQVFLEIRLEYTPLPADTMSAEITGINESAHNAIGDVELSRYLRNGVVLCIHRFRLPLASGLES
jgi:hypothetical protein